MRQNELKRKLQRGETVFGPFMCYSGGTFVEIAGMAGFDFVIVDLEHGPISVETAEELCRAAQSAGISPIVRVRKNDGPQIQRALDIGSAGVQVPQIETQADAEATVRAAKYQPYGMRGVSLFTRAGDYTAFGLAGITDRLNAEHMVIVHVEGRRGLENLDQIVTVPHIDVIFLGPYDLSQSFGIPG
ncbi:MAG: aldolase/citrate lyase family protein, partial [Chloroflexota bacterium]